MGKLDNAVGYLSGAMEMVSDHGVGWRRKFIDLSKNANLNIDYIDPTNKPSNSENKIGEDKNYQNSLKKEGKWKELKEYVSQYRRLDLRYTDISDFLIAAIVPGIAQYGTSNEIYVAEEQHKPIFFYCEEGLYNFPNWLFPLIKFNDNKPINIFQKLEDIIQKLCDLNDGKEKIGDEWVLVRKFIEENRSQ